MRIAVLGLGSAGQRHAANALALGHEVVALDPEVSDPPAGVGRAESEAEAIDLADAVVVASPNSFHADQASAALAAGRPALVEKPLAVNAGDAERVVRGAAEAGVPSAVAMNLRFHPAIVALKRLVDQGALGPVRLAEVAFGHDLSLWRPGTDYRTGYSARADLGGGIALDAIHELDYLLWLLGPVETVVAETARLSPLEIDVEDVAAAVLRFGGGAVATVSLNMLEPVYRRGAVVVGDDAVAQWSWGEPELVVRRRDGGVESVAVEADPSRTYLDVLEDFIAAVRDGGDPRTPVGEGAQAVRLVEALKRSAAEGRRIALTDA